MAGTALIWDLLARDQGASSTFLRVAGAADKAAASTAKASAGMAVSTARMGKAGATLTKKVTLPLLAIGAVAVDQAAKFQKSMTLIQTAGGETAAKTAVISKGLMSVAKSTGTSLGQLSDGIYTVAKAGGQRWTANEQLLLMKAAAQGAKAENVDLGTATNALTSIMTSYGAKAGDAVKYENMLIRGSGLAKTSMREFADSLSNVVPLASSLGIGFDQVAGAIDTMTQHGESAQQATDNLNNLIRNLAGGNNVAASTMLQLGINTVSLSKTLSSPNGLSKALGIVHEALQRHSKDGMVVVDTQKASVLATKSLSQMMGSFSGSLKEQSHELLSGKEGISEYQKYAKSLGGTAGAGALQFLALYKSSKGFSDQLKAGRSTTLSVTQALQKMLGGATGLNVALMLGLGTTKESANSALIFGQSIKSVADAAKNSGADVLGWAKTQDTLAVKIDKAKASMQVMAVELGTALIPTVSKLADAGTKALHWVDGLSGTQKKVLVYSVGVLAALGPLLTIGTRLAFVGRGIGIFVSGVGSRLATLAGASEASAGRVGVAMGRVGAALGGASIGLAIGTLTRDSSDATKAVGALASAATGAAMGFGATGTPFGAAIGGAAGLLTSLGAAFLGSGDSAQKAAQNISTYTDAIKADTGALGKNLSVVVAKSLQDSGALDDARKLGINLSLVTAAAEGNKRAMDAISLSLVRYTVGVYGNTKDTSKQTAAARELLTVLGGTSGQVNKAAQAYRNERDALGGTTTQSHAAASATSTVGAAAANAKVKVAGLTINSGQLANALGALRGSHPVNVSTGAAESNIASLRSTIGGLLSDIENANGRTIHVAVAASNSMPGTIGTIGNAGVAKPKQHKASGGPVRDGYFTVGESTNPNSWELGYKQGSRLDFYSNPQSKHMTGWNNVPGFASGTDPKNTVNGVSYASARAAANARVRAKKADQGTLSSLVSSAIGNVGSAASLKFNINDVGNSRIRAQLKAAVAVLNTEVRKGLSKNAAAKYRSEIAAYTREANRQLGALRVKIKGSDLTALQTALKGTADDVRSAITALVGDVKNAGAGSGLVGSVQTLGNRLVGLQTRLQSMTDYRTSITDTLSGAFNLTQYGSGEDLRAGLGSATDTNKAYSNEISSLYSKLKGNKDGLALVNQLASSGQTATLQTLAGESLSDLSKDVGAYSSYSSSITGGGNAAVGANFGGQSIAQVQSQIADTNGAIADLARAFTNMHLQVDGKDIGPIIDGRAKAEVDAAIRALEQKARTRVKSKGRG